MSITYEKEAEHLLRLAADTITERGYSTNGGVSYYSNVYPHRIAWTTLNGYYAILTVCIDGLELCYARSTRNKFNMFGPDIESSVPIKNLKKGVVSCIRDDDYYVARCVREYGSKYEDLIDDMVQTMNEYVNQDYLVKVNKHLNRVIQQRCVNEK